MGGAFAAVSDDENALLHNPAGAADAGGAQVAFAHSKPFQGLEETNVNLNFFAGVFPVSNGLALGGGWANLIAPVYRQNTAMLLAAASLNYWMPNLSPSVNVGVNLRHLHHRFDLDARAAQDPVFAGGRSEAALALDAGLLVKPEPDLAPGLALALVVKALNEPDLGLADQDKVPREWTAGAAYGFGRLTLAFDAVRRREEATWRAGAETWLWNRHLGFRTGANSTSASAGLTLAFKIGGGNRLALDYALSYPLRLEEPASSHRAAFKVQF